MLYLGIFHLAVFSLYIIISDFVYFIVLLCFVYMFLHVFFFKYILWFVWFFVCIVGLLKRETEGVELGRWGGGEDLVGTMIRIYYNKNSMCIYSTRK